MYGTLAPQYVRKTSLACTATALHTFYRNSRKAEINRTLVNQVGFATFVDALAILDVTLDGDHAAITLCDVNGGGRVTLEVAADAVVILSEI